MIYQQKYYLHVSVKQLPAVYRRHKNVVSPSLVTNKIVRWDSSEKNTKEDLASGWREDSINKKYNKK